MRATRVFQGLWHQHDHLKLHAALAPSVHHIGGTFTHPPSDQVTPWNVSMIRCLMPLLYINHEQTGDQMGGLGQVSSTALWHSLLGRAVTS